MVSGDNFKTDLRRLTREMYQINMQYQIYWICKNRNDRSKYVNVLNEYIHFFAPIMGALRTSVMIGLYKMYDVDRDALSITNFLKYCDNEKLISKKIASRLKNKIDKNKSIKKIRIIRNNAVGHLNWKLDIDQTYNKAGIKYNELKKLIDLSFLILEKIHFGYHKARTSYHDVFCAEGDTYKMLDNLLVRNFDPVLALKNGV